MARGAFIQVWHEDRDLIAVEKPAGVYAEAPPSTKVKTIVDDVHAYLRRKYRLARASFLMPLHRLDRETSGVMIFAKSNAGKQLSSQFRDHLIDRRYLAVVDGVVDDDQGVIETPLEKGDFGGGRKARPGTGEGSRPAKSRYRVVERYADATLVDIEVKTGRTHQIRVHMAELGHPLIGDKVYGGSSRFKRHALHAHTLNFRHPATHKKIALRSPLPQDMAALVEDLRHGQ